MDTYEVVVAGAGPAGSATAKELKANGLNALVIERERLPRYKMCSGLVAPSAHKSYLSVLGRFLRNVIANKKNSKASE